MADADEICKMVKELEEELERRDERNAEYLWLVLEIQGLAKGSKSKQCREIVDLINKFMEI